MRKATLQFNLIAGLTIVGFGLLGLLVACGNDNPVRSTTSPAATLTQITSLPTVTTWERIWGDPDAGIQPLLVGERGLVFRYNGLTWDSLNSGPDVDRVMHAVWGTTANNLRMVGRVTGRTDTLYDTTDDGEEYSYVGTIPDLPILSQYNGANFSDEPIDDIEWGLYDIWGTADDNIYAVGYDGTIIHRDATGWSRIFGGGDTPTFLNSLWGTGPNDIYTSGRNGALLHYDGADWAVISTRIGHDIWDVWGLDSTAVYGVGESGLIFTYDGSAITIMETDVTRSLYSIWGTSASNLYAVGWNGTLLHYDGAAWSEVGPLTEFGLTSVWGTGPNDIWVAGEIVLHYDGIAWEPVTVRREPDINDVYAGTSDYGSVVMTVGTHGAIQASAGNNLFYSATVDGGQIDSDLYGVGGNDDTAQFVVGADGLILQRGDYDDEWLTMPASPTMNDLYAVDAISSEYAVAVGAGGTLLQYDGAQWNQPAVGLTSEDLYDVWLGEVGSDTVGVAVGESGVILRFNGTNWSDEDSPTDHPLLSVTVLTSGDAYAVSLGGTVVRYLASTGVWSQIDVGSSQNLRAIWAGPANNVFIGGEDGQLFQLVSGKLSAIESTVGFDFNGISGYEATDFIVVGNGNHILRYSP